MAQKVPGKRGGFMNRWEKGESGNPKGRPRKLVSQLQKNGYKISEINDTIQNLMAMDISELKEVWDNPYATVLEKTIASALKKSMEKGTLDSMETLLTRVFGKPKEKVEQDINITNHTIKLKFGNEKGDDK